MPLVNRNMMRCVACTRWWSIGPGEPEKCGCGGDLALVDMKAHIGSLPQGARTHSHHPVGTRAPRGECSACDQEYLAEANAKKAAEVKP